MGEIIPLEYNVRVRPEAVEERTKGGVLIPESTRDREQTAAQYGTLEAVAPGAFVYEAGGETYDMKPPIGARVAYVRYAGAWLESEGVRLMKDKDVLGWFSE